MIFNEMDVNMPGLETVFEPSTSSIPTFIYHDIEHERLNHGNEAIVQEAMKDEESPVRLEIRRTLDSRMDPTLQHEHVYDFTNGNTKMVSEDAEKRRVRRERNKLAASKCRKKRKDHVTKLLESYEQLEVCNKNLESDIEKLHNEIRELEKMLDTHPCTRLLYTETGNDSLS